MKVLVDSEIHGDLVELDNKIRLEIFNRNYSLTAYWLTKVVELYCCTKTRAYLIAVYRNNNVPTFYSPLYLGIGYLGITLSCDQNTLEKLLGKVSDTRSTTDYIEEYSKAINLISNYATY